MHHTNSFRYTKPFRFTLYSMVFAAAVMITGSAVDSPADPVPASNMTIAGPTGHLPANKSFLEGVRAHG